MSEDKVTFQRTDSGHGTASGTLTVTVEGLEVVYEWRYLNTYRHTEGNPFRLITKPPRLKERIAADRRNRILDGIHSRLFPDSEPHGFKRRR